jgi:tartrate-resistant acid phosphatase type 5
MISRQTIKPKYWVQRRAGDAAPSGMGGFMLTINTTRRQLISSTSLLISAAAISPRALAQDVKPELNFLVVGDWGRDGKMYQRQVAVQMDRAASLMRSRFVVSTGDNFYTLGVRSLDDSKWGTSFEDIYYRYPSLQTNWYPVLGNHDYGGNIDAQLGRVGRDSRWQMGGRWYDLSLEHQGRPDVHLFFIDSVVWKGRESFPFNLVGSKIHRGDQQIQKDWLVDKLSRSDARIKLVFGHHPIYSVGPHGGKMDMRDLDNVLREGGVTAYICGHDHCLYHIRRSGMDYICSGGGSQELTGFTGDRGVPGCVLRGQCEDLGTTNPIWYSFLDRAGFAAFSIGQDRVDFRFIDRAGMMSPPMTCLPRD